MNHSTLRRWIAAAALIAVGLGIGSFSRNQVDAQSQSPSPLVVGGDNIFVQLAKEIVPSVVNISTVSRVDIPYRGGVGPEDLFRRFFDDFFRQYGGRQRGMPDGGPGGGEEEEGEEDSEGMPSMPRAVSLGTGFIIDSGLILTNNHVVANADEIKITFTEDRNEQPTDGEVVGRDPELDLALIKVKSNRKMIPLKLGDSNALQVGEYVMAVGNPFGQGHSVTHGIISAKERKAPDFILANYLQTDAPINPGNSGGPLVSLKGEVIGINNAIDQRANGIGFAIPIDLVKKVLPQLKSKGTVARGYIGVLVNELTPEIAEQLKLPKDTRAPFVTHVYPGAPAAKAKIKPYDVISEVNGQKIHNSADLVNTITSVTVNESAKLKIFRSGKEIETKVVVTERPASPQLADHREQPNKQKPKQGSSIDLGMDLENLPAGKSSSHPGVRVVDVEGNGPAMRAGLTSGDVIIEVNQRPVKSVRDFYSIVKAKGKYLLRVQRPGPPGGGREAFAVVVLELK